jgi:hypothetical protein
MKIGMCSMCAQPPVILSKDKLFFTPTDWGCWSSCDVTLSENAPHIFILISLFTCTLFLYIRSSVHRNSRLKKSNKMQQYADIYLLLNYSTCFGRPSHPSSEVRKIVVAASGTDPYLVTFKEACSPDSMICTRGCNYSLCPYLVTFKEACSPDSMICTRGCNYSFMSLFGHV